MVKYIYLLLILCSRTCISFLYFAAGLCLCRVWRFHCHSTIIACVL